MKRQPLRSKKQFKSGTLILNFPRFRTVSNKLLKLLLFMGHFVCRVPAQVSEQTESTKSASYFLLHKHQAQTATSCPLSINC